MRANQLINRSVKYLDAAIDAISDMSTKHASIITINEMLKNSKTKDEVTRFLSDLGNNLYNFHLAKDNIMSKKRHDQGLLTLFFAMFITSIVASGLGMISIHSLDLPAILLKCMKQYMLVIVGVVLYLLIIGTCLYVTKYITLARSFNMNIINHHKYVQKLTEMLNIQKLSSTMVINTNNPVLVFYTSLTKGWNTNMKIIINEEIPESCDLINSTTNEKDFLTRCIPPSHAGHVYPFLGVDAVFPVNDVREGVKSFDVDLLTDNLYNSVNYMKSILLDQTTVSVSRSQLVNDISEVFLSYISIIDGLSIKSNDFVSIAKVDDIQTCFNLCFEDPTCQAATFDSEMKSCSLLKKTDLNSLQFEYKPQGCLKTVVKTSTASNNTSEINYPLGVNTLNIASMFTSSPCSINDIGCLIGENGAPSYIQNKNGLVDSRYSFIAGTDMKYARYKYVESNLKLVRSSRSKNYQDMLSNYNTHFINKVCEIYQSSDPYGDTAFNTSLISDIQDVITTALGTDVSVLCVSEINSILLACPAALLTRKRTIQDKYIDIHAFYNKILNFTSAEFVEKFIYHIDRIRKSCKGVLDMQHYYDSSMVLNDSNSNVFKISMAVLPIIYATFIVSTDFTRINKFYLALMGIIAFEVLYTYNQKANAVFSVNKSVKDQNDNIIVRASSEALMSIFSMITLDHAIPLKIDPTLVASHVPVEHMYFQIVENCLFSEASHLIINASSHNFQTLFENILQLLKTYESCNGLIVRDPGISPFPLLKVCLFLSLLCISLIGFLYLVDVIDPIEQIRYIKKLDYITKSLPSNLTNPGSNKAVVKEIPNQENIFSFLVQSQNASQTSQWDVSKTYTLACVSLAIVVIASVLIVRDANTFETRIYNSSEYRNNSACLSTSSI